MAKKKAAKKKASKKKAKKKVTKKARKKSTKKPKEEKKPARPTREKMGTVLERHPDMMETGTVVTPDQFGIFAYPRLFTGVIDIDLVLRPTIGKRMCLIGEESKGKTLTTHIFEGAAQKTCRQCFTPIIPWINEETGEIKERCKCGKNEPCSVIHIDIEDSFDPWWARAWGVEIEDRIYEKDGYRYRKSADDSLFVVIPDDCEAAFNFAADAVRSGAADFVVIDSIAMVLPKADIERGGKTISVGNEKVGARAKIVGAGLTRILNGQIYAKKTYGSRATIAWTNQYYQGPTKMAWESPNKPAAGMRARHAADLIMKFLRATRQAKKKDTDQRAGSKYMDITFVTDKSKSAGTPGGKGEYRVYLDDIKTQHGMLTAGSTDEADRLKDYLSDLGLFEKVGSSHYSCLGRKFKRVGDIITFLNRRDIQYIARYFIFRELLPVSALAYLEESDYAYSPWGRDVAFDLFAKKEEENTTSIPSATKEEGGGEEEGTGTNWDDLLEEE